jgi:bifunctional N-acetylglucosamine-1-phosphate-uridyltransferase/glucosamine-1-phosphate-acetyltransferase GlmU-like protein
MKQILAIPAAGKGSRLNADIPKIFTPIWEGKTVFDFIVESLSPAIDQVILLLSPEGKIYFEKHFADKAPRNIEVLIQASATGMFDAVDQLVSHVLSIPDDVHLLLQWGDQPFCDTSLYHAMFADLQSNDASVPLVWVANPYVQYQFSTTAVHVFEHREGDVVDSHGFKDMGIFGLRKSLLQASWGHYAQQASKGKVTGEKNFVKYIGTLHPKFQVFWRLDQPFYKSLGINTPAELAEATLYVKQRQAI